MASPSQPLDIKSHASQLDQPDETAPASLAASIGTPNLNALRAQYAGTTPPPNIPLRGATPTITGSPIPASLLPSSGTLTPRLGSQGGISATAMRRTDSLGNGNGDDEASQTLDIDNLPDEEKAKVLRRHLVSKKEREGGASTDSIHSSGSDNNVAPDVTGESTPLRFSRRPSSSVNPDREDSEPFPIPYHAPGADVTHDIYKWHAGVSRNRARAASFHGPTSQQDPAFEHIHEPGGFRRNYVLLRATEQGVEEPHILNNFIDFLYIFGHFAGEDLEEEEEEDNEDVEEGSSTARIEGLRALPEISEETPLISSSKTRTRRRRMSVGPQGTATVTQAVLILLKGFVGTGVLFLGKGFANGGLLFSTLTFVGIAAVSLYSFLLLMKAKFRVSGSFGDIGGMLYGSWMRYLILGSIVLSQIGFVSAYTIFVAQNFQAFVMGITKCLKLISMQNFILLQLIIFLPLALVRDIAKLSSAALIADAFILAGLVYIFGSEASILSHNGPQEVKLFNPKDFPLFIGTAVFSFEGIGLVIPITDSMREPHKFPAVLTGVMAFVTVLFGGAGALGYLTFGSKIETVVLVNLNSDSGVVQAVQFLYALAILLSIPLQFFPAVRILENGLFTRSGKVDVRIKWLKNCFRFVMVMVCTVISWAGAADLDKFVAFVGCFACVPLCYVYPAMLHYRACARTLRQKIADIALMVFGMLVFVYTSVQTLRLMMGPAPPPPRLGGCEPRT